MTPQPETGTLARAMQVVLALEVLVLVFGLGLLWSLGKISGCTWILLALGWYVGFRVIANGKNFLQTWLARSAKKPEHELNVLGTLRLLWGETWAMFLVYSWLFPFERRVPLAPRPASGGKGTPIVLVPGFACNRGYWRHYVRWLQAAKLGPVYAVSLEPLFGSIDENARRLGERVEAICQQTGAGKVILIGHSMGGVTIRAYLHNFGGAPRIAKILTLGSPHRGTVLTQGIGGLGENIRQMSRGSTWAMKLNAHETQPCPVPITAVITPHDDIVAPQDSCELLYPNARNVFTPGIGHLEMVISRPVFDVVLAELKS